MALVCRFILWVPRSLDGVERVIWLRLMTGGTKSEPTTSPLRWTTSCEWRVVTNWFTSATRWAQPSSGCPWSRTRNSTNTSNWWLVIVDTSIISLLIHSFFRWPWHLRPALPMSKVLAGWRPFSSTKSRWFEWMNPTFKWIKFVIKLISLRCVWRVPKPSCPTQTSTRRCARCSAAERSSTPTCAAISSSSSPDPIRPTSIWLPNF